MFLLTVATIWAVAAITPGPNFLVVAQTSLSSGRRPAVAAVFGIVTGTLVWGLAGWLGISALFAAAPAAFLLLKIVGGAYLVWLGLRLLWASYRSGADTRGTFAGKSLSIASAYRLGLVTILANPKSAIFVTSVFAAALPHDYHWAHGLASVGVMIAISSLWYLAVAFVLAKPRISSMYLRGKRIVDAATGILFAGLGARLILAQR